VIIFDSLKRKPTAFEIVIVEVVLAVLMAIIRF